MHTISHNKIKPMTQCMKNTHLFKGEGLSFKNNIYLYSNNNNNK